MASCDHQVYNKTNKRLMVKIDKASGLAAADNGKTSNPYVVSHDRVIICYYGNMLQVYTRLYLT